MRNRLGQLQLQFGRRTLVPQSPLVSKFADPGDLRMEAAEWGPGP